MKKVVVLGAGLVGREVARDLAPHFDVTSVDSSQERLEKASLDTSIHTRVADLSDAATVLEVVAPADVVVGGLPGFMAKAALETVIRAGKNVVDIAFFPEDPFVLDDLAKEHGVTALVDFCVAPGMSNIFMGFHNAEIEQV